MKSCKLCELYEGYEIVVLFLFVYVKLSMLFLPISNPFPHEHQMNNLLSQVECKVSPSLSSQEFYNGKVALIIELSNREKSGKLEYCYYFTEQNFFMNRNFLHYKELLRINVIKYENEANEIPEK